MSLPLKIEEISNILVFLNQLSNLFSVPNRNTIWQELIDLKYLGRYGIVFTEVKREK